MLRAMRSHLKNARARQGDTVRLLEKELSEPELAISRLY
jgi:hypothetical protein